MPSTRWRSNRCGPDFLMDQHGRLIGYRDSSGLDHQIPNAPVSGGQVSDSTEPATNLGGGASDFAGLLGNPSENVALRTVLERAQGNLLDGHSALVIPGNNGFTLMGHVQMGWTGNISNQGPNYSSAFTARARERLTSAAAANSGARVGSSSSFLNPLDQFNGSNIFGPSPKRHVFAFGTADSLTACRMYVGFAGGLSDSVEPSTASQGLFLGCDSTDLGPDASPSTAQLKLYIKYAGQALIRQDLNLTQSGFPAHTNQQDYYLFTLDNYPNPAGRIEWRVENVVTGMTATGVISSFPGNLFTNTPFGISRSTAANTSACSIDVGGVATGGFASFLGGASAPVVPTARSVSADVTAIRSDANALMSVTGANPINVTLPSRSSVPFDIMDTIPVLQRTTGGVPTFVAGAGVTLRTPSNLDVMSQWRVRTATMVANDEWLIA